jgi:UDP-2,3-diacylglucosamine pyrophosphatase LpxH
MSRRLFLSDTHMSAGLGLVASDGRHPWEWFTERDCRRLCWFLAHLKEPTPSQPPIDELVLLGDIFDNWVFPHDVKPPTFKAILASEHIRPAITLLNELSTTTDILFLPGNHDLTLSHVDLMSALPRIGFGGQGKDRPMYGGGRVLGEHGNAVALFCSPDPLRQDGLPLGYFISRMAATADRDTGSHAISTTDVIRELAQFLGHGKLARDVFEAICAKAHVSRQDRVLMPDDLWGGQTVRVGDIGDMYQSLLGEYEHRNGAIETAMAIPAELGDLVPVADARFVRFGSKLVLMGHTHKVALVPQTLPLLGQVAYVNTGSWCNNTEKATWVEVEKTDRTYAVSVMSCSRMPSDSSPPTVAPVFDRVVIS